MYESLDLFQTAQAASRHAGKKQAVAARNIANADTPGYRALMLPDFATVWRDDPAGHMRATRARHLNGYTSRTQLPDARLARNTEAAPNGNSVSLETELMVGVDAGRQHDRAMAVYRSGLTMLRAALGRR